MAQAAAEELAKQLERPSCIKLMCQSHVKKGFLLSCLGDIHLAFPEERMECYFEHDGKHWGVIHLQDRVSFSGGWKRVAEDMKLDVDDVVLFESAGTLEGKPRVKLHVFRHAHYAEKSQEYGPEVLRPDATILNLVGKRPVMVVRTSKVSTDEGAEAPLAVEPNKAGKTSSAMPVIKRKRVQEPTAAAQAEAGASEAADTSRKGSTRLAKAVAAGEGVATAQGAKQPAAKQQTAAEGPADLKQPGQNALTGSKQRVASAEESKAKKQKGAKKADAAKVQAHVDDQQPAQFTMPKRAQQTLDRHSTTPAPDCPQSEAYQKHQAERGPPQQVPAYDADAMLAKLHAMLVPEVQAVEVGHRGQLRAVPSSFERRGFSVMSWWRDNNHCVWPVRAVDQASKEAVDLPWGVQLAQ
ncbi:hypothetical protein V8C86DRAFT_2801346 [Haematococcus lacustris]